MSATELDPATIYHIPKQKPPPDPVPAEMRLLLSSYPPLSQVTQTGLREIVFYALLEVDQTRASKPWQVALWHCSGGGGSDEQWVETALARTAVEDEPRVLQSLDASLARLYFHGKLPVHPSRRFTLKFREAPDHEWLWVRDAQRMEDGMVIVNTAPGQESTAQEPADIVKDLNPALKVRSAASQCPGTELWTFEAAVPGADGDSSSFTDIEVGLPWGGFLR